MDDIFKVLKEKSLTNTFIQQNCQKEGKIKIVLDKKKMREFIAYRPTSQEIQKKFMLITDNPTALI